MKAAADSRTIGRSDRKAVQEPALWGLVGNTPLIPIRLFDGATVRLKCEWLNPGGSVKDRAALFILRDGIAQGVLPGKRLLDASSGNTAIAYAMLGAARGSASRYACRPTRAPSGRPCWKRSARRSPSP